MLTEKEKKIKLLFEKQLEMPKWQYIILYGVVAWGLTVLVIMSLVDMFIFNKSLERQWAEGLLYRILLMPFAGLFFGWFMRRLSEKRLVKLKEKENLP